MARYKKIVKKKEKSMSILDSTESATHWAQEHLSTIALGLGAALLILAAGYGVAYYRQTSSMDTQVKLFEATAGEESGVVDKLAALIKRGGKDKVINQARIELARQLFGKGKYKEAAVQYSDASAISGKGTLIYELATLGEANCIAHLGDLSKAEAKYMELLANSVSYPKDDVFLNLAFVQASIDKKEEAIAMLEKLKSLKGPGDNDVIDTAIRNVREGKFVGVMEKAALSDEKKPVSGAGATNLKIHESGAGGQ